MSPRDPPPLPLLFGAPAAPATTGAPVRMSLEQAMQQALGAYGARAWQQAEQLCRAIIKSDPRHFPALNLLGILTAQTERPEEAAALLECAVAVRPNDADACRNLGVVLQSLQRYDEAYDSFTRAFAARPNDAETSYRLGNLLKDRKRFAEALAAYERALRIRPDYAEAHYNRAASLQALARSEEALQGYELALRARPGFAEAYNNRGNVLQSLKRYAEALASYDQALELRTDYADAWNNRGNALQVLRRHPEALASYARALELRGNFPEAYNNRGNALHALERHDEALASYAEALKMRPDYVDAWNNRGNVLQALKRDEEALESYAQALRIRPDCADAWNNGGNALLTLRRYEEALGSFERAIALAPHDADPYNNRGNLFGELKQYDEALVSFDRAVAIRPDYADAHGNRGHLLQELKRYEDARASYARALEVAPDAEWLYGGWLFTRMRLCDWADFERASEELCERVRAGRRATSPFQPLALRDDPALHRRAAQIWVEGKYPARSTLPPPGSYPRHERVRIGYFSGDFRSHPVAALLAEVLESHDRSRFELSAFSFGPGTGDAMRRRIEQAVEHFVDVRAKSDLEIVRLARSAQLDIAIDLGGFTEGGRPDLFALRVAPLQVSYLGYLGTLGAPYMDYLIADPTLVPLEARVHYTEQILSLPCYQANDSKRSISPKRFTREELGLPPEGFVYCCFNASYKLTPTTFARWMRILHATPGSVLWLLAESPTVEGNLRAEAERSGIAPERLVFGARLAMPEYLARYRAADLFLDTLPYNAGTTGSDALFVGLPLLTLKGQSFPARVAASLLTALGLPELITESEEAYEATAIALAKDPVRLADLKRRLECARTTSPLFDTPRFTRSLETAYRAIYERSLSGLTPEHLEIP